MIDAVGVEKGSAPLDAVHFITLADEELSEIGPSWPVTPLMSARLRFAKRISLRWLSSGLCVVREA